MVAEIKMTGRLVAAARALTGVSRRDFARAAGLTAERIAEMEAKGSARLRSKRETDAVIRAFEKFGVVALGEEGGMGAGVRLKFTRQDVEQIARLEGEGGPPGKDAAP